ncbi:MAG TPA: hypothetical protein VFU10_10840 [Gaiellaceae bacterium]|nr:hypothetical protein [Gaiellaceae bacterium]
MVAQRHDALPPTTCGSYTVVNVVRLDLINAFYVVNDKIWGFGMTTGRVAPCLP